MPGRRPLPANVHTLRGTSSDTAIPTAPKPRPATPAMPKHLTPGARVAWRELVAALRHLRVLTHADRTVLEIASEALAEYRAARHVLDAEGATYSTTTPTGSVMHRPRPEVSMAADAWRRTKGALVELGLTPAARTRVTVASEPRGPNPFERRGKPTGRPA